MTCENNIEQGVEEPPCRTHLRGNYCPNASQFAVSSAAQHTLMAGAPDDRKRVVKAWYTQEDDKAEHRNTNGPTARGWLQTRVAGLNVYLPEEDGEAELRGVISKFKWRDHRR